MIEDIEEITIIEIITEVEEIMTEEEDTKVEEMVEEMVEDLSIEKDTEEDLEMIEDKEEEDKNSKDALTVEKMVTELENVLYLIKEKNNNKIDFNKMVVEEEEEDVLTVMKKDISLETVLNQELTENQDLKEVKEEDMIEIDKEIDLITVEKVNIHLQVHHPNLVLNLLPNLQVEVEAKVTVQDLDHLLIENEI